MGKYPLSKLQNKLHLLSELNEINEKIIPLKALADRELASIYGLTGMVYTPYLDDYMQVSIEKAAILACLKRQKILPLSEVELITTALDSLHKSAKSNAIVEYEGNCYQRRFSPLKLNKSGKTVRKWARYWLLQSADGRVEPNWQAQVREIWPSYFLIRTVGL
ncbi:hypothetical protein CMT41_06255 [Colwellia sp. MT41]|uniref:Uncharacterized protein n=1 Tax=Colwellia marinimaniae TaxID=1513592 RepID=A0ABQ0MZ06_9GAMM|nr:hypothetical protein CMT41_06255 [Colwellia sp. MT41]GAW97580.1 hypothetical protein MTCD1_03209 [Colwellia marinimaniae]